MIQNVSTVNQNMSKMSWKVLKMTQKYNLLKYSLKLESNKDVSRTKTQTENVEVCQTLRRIKSSECVFADVVNPFRDVGQ